MGGWGVWGGETTCDTSQASQASTLCHGPQVPPEGEGIPCVTRVKSVTVTYVNGCGTGLKGQSGGGIQCVTLHRRQWVCHGPQGRPPGGTYSTQGIYLFGSATGVTSVAFSHPLFAEVNAGPQGGQLSDVNNVMSIFNVPLFALPRNDHRFIGWINDVP